MDGIRVTGIGEVAAIPGESLEGLIHHAASAALADAQLTRDDLDGVVIAASDQVDGRAISSMLTSGPAGAYLNEEINVASSPAHALVLACLQVASGTHRRLLVSSWGKASESKGSSTEAAERLSIEPFYERDAGLGRLAAAGLQAQAHRSGGPDRQAFDTAAARVAAKNHGSGVSAADVLASAPLALPLRALEWPTEIDGAFSIVVEDDGRATSALALVRGFGWCADGATVGGRDLVGLPHLRRAAADAYQRAGVADAASEIGTWEIHDYSPDAELTAYAALGLCPDGDALELALSGATGPGGPHPVNPDGGSVRGEAPFGGPLRKVLSAVRRLRTGTSPADAVVAQMSAGPAGQFQTVFVLGAQA